MPDEKICPKCKARMELGHAFGQRLAGRWVEGDGRKAWPLPGFGKRILSIDLYRCTSCGFIESYAP